MTYLESDTYSKLIDSHKELNEELDELQDKDNII